MNEQERLRRNRLRRARYWRNRDRILEYQRRYKAKHHDQYSNLVDAVMEVIKEAEQRKVEFGWKLMIGEE